MSEYIVSTDSQGALYTGPDGDQARFMYGAYEQRGFEEVTLTEDGVIIAQAIPRDGTEPT